MDIVFEIAKNAKKCSHIIAAADTSLKNKVLKDISEKLISESGEIIEANKEDVKKSRKAGISDSLLDRLKLDKGRIQKIAEV